MSHGVRSILNETAKKIIIYFLKDHILKLKIWLPSFVNKNENYWLSPQIWLIIPQWAKKWGKIDYLVGQIGISGQVIGVQFYCPSSTYPAIVLGISTYFVLLLN